MASDSTSSKATAAPPERAPASSPTLLDPTRRDDYRSFLTIPTRWLDNDAYGHVNNVVYYAYFDTAVNEHLIRAGGLDVEHDPVVGYVVETSCRFDRPLTFPERVEAGLRVTKLGTSSVVYQIGLFREGEDKPAAQGRFVHVWVERATQRPSRVPDKIRRALAPLMAGRERLPSPRSPSGRLPKKSTGK